MKRIILIDFSWLYNKYYYVAKYSKSQKGGGDYKNNFTDVVKRMLSQFLNIIKNFYSDSKIMMVLDSSTSSLVNTTLYEGYKQNRNKEEKKEVYKDLNNVIIHLHEFFSPKSSQEKRRAFFVKAKMYEADQVIASLVKKYSSSHEVIIFSGDKDLIQLTSFPNTYISDKFEKGQFILKTDEELFEKFKSNKGESFTRVSTNKRDILKYRSLKGDTSDNLSPVFPRIKDKEIINIIQNYWIDDQEEGLSEIRMNDIIDDIREDNKDLASKLYSNRDIWLRNYLIMDLLHVDDISIKVLR